jgi:hypothetical protein
MERGIIHENSILLFQKYAVPLFRDGIKVLEIGRNKLTHFSLKFGPFHPISHQLGKDTDF